MISNGVLAYISVYWIACHTIHWGVDAHYIPNVVIPHRILKSHRERMRKAESVPHFMFYDSQVLSKRLL